MRIDLRLALIGSFLGILGGCALWRPKPTPPPLQEAPAKASASTQAVGQAKATSGSSGEASPAASPGAGIAAGATPVVTATAGPDSGSKTGPWPVVALTGAPVPVQRAQLHGGSAGRNSGSLLIGNGAAAREVPDGSDDDIIARRLRRAAEYEADPALREKLWKEYVDYRDHIRH